MRLLTSSLMAVCLINTGCATMFHGSTAAVTVRTEEPGTKIYINDSYAGTGSATMELPKKGNHTIRVSKQGCEDNSQAVRKSFDATSLLGFLLDWGIISILLVDGLGTGAINDIQPKHYVLNPNCETAQPAAAQYSPVAPLKPE